ncbi:MAG: dependent oxidoreductase, partial [Clostridia bacterium]|nr:dependent oxidoreductase [Clostridia bacterium]
LCDGHRKKVIGGIAEELLYTSIKYGYNNLPSQWNNLLQKNNITESEARYQTVFSPACFTVALDELLISENITILYDTVFVKSIMDNNTCIGIVVENKSGRGFYKGKMFIDATGDADLAYSSNIECENGDNWLSYWCYLTDEASLKNCNGNIQKAFILSTLGADASGNDSQPRKYIGTDKDEITDFIINGRKLLLEKMKNTNKIPITLPSIAQFRTTRKIKGMYTLSGKDLFQHSDDSIGCIGDWRKKGPIYEIPYRTLINSEIKNVIAAGRCISSCGDTWEVTRVIPAAAATGQSAGTAAAIAIKNAVSLQNIDILSLQKVLADNGVLIHY